MEFRNSDNNYNSEKMMEVLKKNCSIAKEKRANIESTEQLLQLIANKKNKDTVIEKVVKKDTMTKLNVNLEEVDYYLSVIESLDLGEGFEETLLSIVPTDNIPLISRLILELTKKENDTTSTIREFKELSSEEDLTEFVEEASSYRTKKAVLQKYIIPDVKQSAVQYQKRGDN